MGIKTKMRIRCGIVSFLVFLTSSASAIPVMAEDGPTEGQMRVYEHQKAAQEYVIEHVNEPQQDYANYDDRYWNNDRWWYDGHWWYNGRWWYEPSGYYTSVHHVYITLDLGDTYSVAGIGVSHVSTDPNVASVDGSGLIKANNHGDCNIESRWQNGSIRQITHVHVRRRDNNNNNNNNNNNSNNNNVVYTPAVNTATWLAIANNLVVATPKGGVVNLSSATPLYFDSNFANILKLRPDVTVNVTFGYNGHFFLLTIPKGYNLSSKLNAAGAVDFITLSNIIDGKIRCTLLY